MKISWPAKATKNGFPELTSIRQVLTWSLQAQTDASKSGILCRAQSRTHSSMWLLLPFGACDSMTPETSCSARTGQEPSSCSTCMRPKHASSTVRTRMLWWDSHSSPSLISLCLVLLTARFLFGTCALDSLSKRSTATLTQLTTLNSASAVSTSPLQTPTAWLKFGTSEWFKRSRLATLAKFLQLPSLSTSLENY